MHVIGLNKHLLFLAIKMQGAMVCMKKAGTQACFFLILLNSLLLRLAIDHPVDTVLVRKRTKVGSPEHIL